MNIFPAGVVDESSISKSTSGRGSVDKDEFLMLLVTQLQNQDPLNPMDYTEFTSQMAQFSSLEQLYNVNNNLEQLYGYQKGIFNENLSSFVGKDVKIYDNSIDLVEGGASQVTFSLDREAEGIFASIYNYNGELIREINQAENYLAGEHTITWDGMDQGGNQVPGGQYTINIQAVGTGETFSGSPIRNYKVNSVDFNNGVASLRSGEKSINMSDVIGVGEGVTF
ncbi:Flagellar hook capping protein FlgD [uncultured Desulfobacterium sp.]|uniref:Basal-body rod modification protein FlgD n=1 Tax=uncultured Desulfobacterium sp. TaxID=201089 RepID=A0A445MTA7_9BACT|nr:Flagellar hook capping protein FlgD [uncultured Desulfobacterium sp.]